MIWSPSAQYEFHPYDLEADLEAAVLEVSGVLFGSQRIYLDVKKKIGAKGKGGAIPDGYLIDLASHKKPVLYVVENELARHEPLKHVAVQVLQFSLAFETEPQKVKQVVKAALDDQPRARTKCEEYAARHGFENVDYLLEQMVYHGGFRALVIIDELSDELESVLISKFRFPVEVLALARYADAKGHRLYQFEPFLSGIDAATEAAAAEADVGTDAPDPQDIDTIVVPAREEGFRDVFIAQSRWYAIRLHASMVDRIKWVAAYVTSPISAITHIAPVKSVEQWQGGAKYVVNFMSPAKSIDQIPLVRKGKVKAPQAPRYTTYERLMAAKTMDEAF